MTRIIFAGGGTAGHIEPALAVARQWKKMHSDTQILFLGTSTGLENRLVPEAGFQLALITKVRISRKLSPSLLVTPFALIRSIAQSFSILKGADLLVGFGGYVSGPAYIGARLRRTPIVIHEANAHPGIANRLGAHFTSHTAVAYPVSRGKLSHALLAGLPLRPDVEKAFHEAESDWAKARREAKARSGFNTEKPLIFIFGGSQGSIAINSVIEGARTELTSQGLQVLHSVGGNNPLPESDSNYKAVSYITDMSNAYLAADLIISRSGAVSCAEINTLGRFALFIPLPVGNGEQELNAMSLVSESRAELIAQEKFSANWLIGNISRLLTASSESTIEGSRKDIDATTKMVSLMEFAIAGGK
jgi:UDP-N-acetylglucosamine--N-acetylmuramyl-(pentapeptide) pyrophosphoryl-undecaprenol N-acetylglucosamine transferase